MTPPSSLRSLATDQVLAPMDRAIAIMRALRSSEGCPWDREQTMHSLERYTLEEVYELFDAIERESWAEIRDELGDVLLQVLFYAQIAEDAGEFGIEDVAAGLNAKLIRRHPHVFGDAVAADAGAVVATWERVKRTETRAAATEGVLGDVPRGMPAMLEAAKLGSRASKVGFDWPEADGILAKLAEEICELRLEMAAAAAAKPAEVEAELGDVLFTVVNVARHLGVDPETALRGSNAKFRRRFSAMEAAVGGGRDALTELSAEEWEQLWQRAKAGERQAR